MKVLVTGATGRVGANVSRMLIDQGHEVRAFVMAGDSQLPKIAGTEGLEVYEGSLQSLRDCEQAVHGTTAVVHLAAQLVRGQTPVDQFYDVNALSTLRLLEAVAHQAESLHRFVLASTDGTYRPGAPTSRPLREGSPQIPADYYGTSKLLGELILANHATQFDIPHTVVRFATVVSPEEAVTMFRRRWIETLLDREALGRDSNIWPLFEAHPGLADLVRAQIRPDAAAETPLAVYCDSGEPWSLHLVDVRDAARGVVLALTHRAAEGEDFFIAATETTDFDAGARAVGEIDGVQPMTVTLPTGWNLDIDTSKAQSLLGFEARYSFPDMVRDGLNPPEEAYLPAVLPR